MVLQYSTLSIENSIQFIDVAEETNAVIYPNKPSPRFHHIIHFIIDGKGYFKTSETQTIEVKKGDAFAIYENDTVYYESVHNNPMHYFWIGFNGEDSERIMSSIGFSKKTPIASFDNIGEITSAFNEAIDALKQEENLLFISKFYKITYLFRKNNKTFSQEFAINDEVFTKAINYMKLNIDKNLKINDLIEYLHIDRSYFSKIFKKKYNLTPYKYYINLKLIKAEFLIYNTDYTLTTISNMLGFPDCHMFSKIYKKHFGISPGSIRKESRQESRKEQKVNL